MPSFKEVQYYLAGLWLLVRLDPRGFRFLDLSERGVGRSFFAILWCLPPIGISWMWTRQTFLRFMPPDTPLGSIFYVRLAMIEVTNWIVPLVLVGFLLMAFRMGPRFAPLVVAFNWLSVPLNYVNGLLLGLLFLLPGLFSLLSLLILAVMIAQAVVVFRIVRMIFHGHGPMIGAITLVLIVPGLVLSDIMPRFLGLYPG